MISSKTIITYSLILLFGFLAAIFYAKHTNNNVEITEFNNPTEAFREIDSQLLAAKIEVEKDFDQLPKYEKPSKDQPIKDALEFVKFSKNTFVSTMEQNTDLISDVKGFEGEAQNILSDTYK